MKTIRERWNSVRWVVIAIWGAIFLIRLIDNSMGIELSMGIRVVSTICVLIIGIDLIVGIVGWLINLGRKALKQE